METAVLNHEAKETPQFSGNYFYALGRRKTSVATVRLYQDAKAKYTVNGLSLNEYFPTRIMQILALKPLEITGMEKDFGMSVVVKGGGKMGQAISVSLAIARCLLKFNPELRMSLKPHGMLTRDPRGRERKKPGLKRARRAPQWRKR